MAKKKAPPTPWEVAKPLLIQDIIDGEITDDMFPRVAKLKRIEYTKVGKNWGNNYRALQASVRKNKNRALRDEAVFNNDTNIYNQANEENQSCNGF